MDIMLLVAIAFATLFNVIVIIAKLKSGRVLDGTLDFIILSTLAAILGGSFNGLVVATITSAGVSIYLLLYPPKITNFKLPKPP